MSTRANSRDGEVLTWPIRKNGHRDPEYLHAALHDLGSFAAVARSYLRNEANDINEQDDNTSKDSFIVK